MRNLPLKPVFLLVFLGWLGLIAIGYTWLFRYSFVAGEASTAPGSVPHSLASSNSSSRWQVFLALHPRCPCSTATVRELAKILTRATDVSVVTVLMYKPSNEPDSWLEGRLLDECRRMNCRVRSDPEGSYARVLGAVTSGDVVVYDASGKLRYHGGITGSRGHEGDNLGQQSVIDLLRGRNASRTSMPVFGCPIQKKDAEKGSL